MGEVGESGFRIEIFAPHEITDMSPRRSEKTRPSHARSPIVSTVLLSPEGKDFCDFFLRQYADQIQPNFLSIVLDPLIEFCHWVDPREPSQRHGTCYTPVAAP